MKRKYNKALIAPGILFILSIVCMVLYFSWVDALMSQLGEMYNFDIPWTYICILAGMLILMLYCLAFQKMGFGKYLLTVGAITIAVPYGFWFYGVFEELIIDGNFDFWYLLKGIEYLSLVIVCLLLVQNKFKAKKGLSTFRFITVLVFLAIVLTNTVVYSLIEELYFYNFYEIALVNDGIWVLFAVAVFIMSIAENRELKLAAAREIESVEDKLVVLKERYENGLISAEEYSEKKLELISKL